MALVFFSLRVKGIDLVVHHEPLAPDLYIIIKVLPGMWTRALYRNLPTINPGAPGSAVECLVQAIRLWELNPMGMDLEDYLKALQLD